jgi:hypothetical protein
MRGRVCSLQMLLGLASAVFLGFESSGTYHHILLSQIRDPPIWRARTEHIDTLRGSPYRTGNTDTLCGSPYLTGDTDTLVWDKGKFLNDTHGDIQCNSPLLLNMPTIERKFSSKVDLFIVIIWMKNVAKKSLTRKSNKSLVTCVNCYGD